MGQPAAVPYPGKLDGPACRIAGTADLDAGSTLDAAS